MTAEVTCQTVTLKRHGRIGHLCSCFGGSKVRVLQRGHEIVGDGDADIVRNETDGCLSGHHALDSACMARQGA